MFAIPLMIGEFQGIGVNAIGIMIKAVTAFQAGVEFVEMLND
jgi:hypothetical protein